MLIGCLCATHWGGRGLNAQPPQRSEDVSKASENWVSNGWPLIQRFCLDCHDQDNKEGELDLSSYDSFERLESHGGAVQRLLEMVQFGAMPPEDANQPTSHERKTLVDAIDRTLFAASCDLRERPGKVTARRLNKTEYNNSIRDLFGMALRPADAFPSDEVGAGFDNNGDILSLSPMLMEKYLAAAEKVASQVLIDPDSLPKLDMERGGDQLRLHGESKVGRFSGRFLADQAFAWADFDIPVDGEYRIRVDGGNAMTDSEPTVVAIYDGTGLLRGHGSLKYYGGSGGAQSFSFRSDFKRGPLRLFMLPHDGDDKLVDGRTVSNRLKDLDPSVIEAGEERAMQPLKLEDRFDRLVYPFMLRRISISGPSQQPKNAYPPSQDLIVRRAASKKDGSWQEVKVAAIECLRPLLRRAFRQSVTEKEVEPYANLVVVATDRGESYYRGLQFAITAMLMSPRFLFRVETPPADWIRNGDEAVALTPTQIATRLSYFLWSSSPDDQLLRDAEAGKLSHQKLEQHVRRMIADERAASLGSEFAAQWLGLRNLVSHEADTDQFETFSHSLKNSMVMETQLLFMHLLRENRPVSELLLSEYSFINAELASHYGIEGIDWEGEQKGVGDGFQRVSLAGTPRRGILTHASVLTLTSNPGRTSPVKRGKWILENVLGTPPPEPPPGVPELNESSEGQEKLTMREQLQMHRANPTCSSCHRVMDELGFGLERFDAIGRYRKFDGDSVVDSSGVLPGGRSFNDTGELSELLGRSEAKAFARTVTKRLMTFALGRELTHADRCVIDEIVSETAATEYRFVDLILQIVKSEPFLTYEWMPPSE